MTPTLYITRNGLLEPLGQSQVLAYLRGLAREFRITVISFEKPEDLADAGAVAALRADCAALGIDWRPLRFRRGPRGLAPAWGLAQLSWQAWRAVRRGARLIHARSYLPAAVALLVGRVTGTPFIFDMRALWPEELITAGRLRRGSLLHRAIVAVERACLRRAAAVVSLTHVGVAHLRREEPEALAGQRVAVIPTCADLERFRPAAAPPERILGCLGTLTSGWFRLDWLAAFLAAAARRDPAWRFEITSRDDPARLQAALAEEPAVTERLAIAPARPAEVPAILQRQTASVMFYAGGAVSELGRSPTRMAEILGCGRPVVANRGVGDVAKIVEESRVGVILEDTSPEALTAALDALDRLLTDPDLPQRCRRTAEEIFSLERGTQAYRALYREILGEGA